MAFKFERDLEKTAIPFLEKRCFKFSWQVPLHNRVVDFVMINQEGFLVGIEFKLKDWKRALEQASLNSSSFDFVYVCLPGGKYLDKLKKDAEELGVGVMVYDDSIDTIKIELEAKKIMRQWKPNIKYLRDYLESRDVN